jgi:uncharacterized protein (TIGR02266 family)
MDNGHGGTYSYGEMAEPNQVETVGIPRPVRVAFPVQVCFEGERFSIDEFTANLSVGGLFLPTDRMIPPRTRGTLTFRISQWEEPFTVEAEVVRTAPPGGGPDNHSCGLGLMFVDLSATNRKRLQRLVEGIRDGSVSETIRRAIREDNKNLLSELRNRPTDQKVMFAVSARGEEIDALIRDGNTAVLQRVLDNPRLTAAQVAKLLRAPRTQTRILFTLCQTARWMSNDEIRFLFCRHPNAPLPEVMRLVGRLSPEQLRKLTRNANLRPQIQARAHAALSFQRAR